MKIRDRIVELRRVKASDLAPNPKNWRKHPKAQADALRGVLAEVGYADALLARQLPDGRLMLVDGHLRAETTPDAEVPVLVLDVTEAEADKILLTLDPLAAMAEADADALSSLLAGFESDSEAVRKMLSDLSDEAGIEKPVVDAPDARIDEAEELRKKWGVERGQLWKIGGHRLLCGDSTSAEDVGRLMGGERASLMHTDPPYGVDYANVLEGRENQKEGGWSEIQGDDLDDTGLEAMLVAAFSLCDAPVAFVWHSWKRVEVFLRALRSCGWRPTSEIVWVKNALVFGRSDYQWRHESCIYAKRDGASRQDDRTATTVWEFPKTTGALHPTQKPVELFLQPISNHTEKAAVVYEPFSGSGSQLIAAERLGRRCYAMEIEPKYVAVALQRLADMGLTPERVDG